MQEIDWLRQSSTLVSLGLPRTKTLTCFQTADLEVNVMLSKKLYEIDGRVFIKYVMFLKTEAMLMMNYQSHRTDSKCDPRRTTAVKLFKGEVLK